MKSAKFIIRGVSISLLLFTMAFIVPKVTAHKVSEMGVAPNGFAVLELFTSEGCSSCPAADALLASIQKESVGKPVYVLAYHVDYWDRLGWKDIFSNPDYSKRQNTYSNWLGTGQVYTPQVVINGKAECVGSDEAVLRGHITTALSATSATVLDLNASEQGNMLSINYQLNNPDDVQLEIAFVQKSAISKVERGENSGRTLSHAQIVRELYPVNIKRHTTGSVQLKVPQGFNTRDWEVVGFLQNQDNGQISAAARATLHSATAQ